jgi:predicted RNase H-like HicB family nuclease
MKKGEFTSAVWKEGKYFVAQCLNIDISSFGDIKNEALKNIEEAIELYLEDKQQKIPKVESPSIETRGFQYA